MREPELRRPRVRELGAPAGVTCSDDGGKVCDGSGQCVGCNATADCSAPATLCLTTACSAGLYGDASAAIGTACTDLGGTVCDGNGTCVGCNTTADCTSGLGHVANKCRPSRLHPTG